MRKFYLILIVLSGIYLAAQLTAYLFFGKRLFADSGELFEHRKNRVEWQTVFPKNLLRLIVFVFVGSLTGLLLDAVGMAGWISMPLGAAGGLVFNFLLETVFSPLYFKAIGSGSPSDMALCGGEAPESGGEAAGFCGMSAVVTEEITEDGYGTICVEISERGHFPVMPKSYYFSAVTANGRTLPVGERVIIVYAQDRLCFVESDAHLCDILFEEEEEPLSDTE